MQKDWTKNKNFIYLPNMQNLGIWAPSRNKIANFFITHEDDHFAKNCIQNG